VGDVHHHGVQRFLPSVLASSMQLLNHARMCPVSAPIAVQAKVHYTAVGPKQNDFTAWAHAHASCCYIGVLSSHVSCTATMAKILRHALVSKIHGVVFTTRVED
jgi:hypothetical protein